jgi:hypothetical protein
MDQKAKWTILTYIAAHNNLDAMGTRSLEQIIQVGSTSQVMHGVLYDGPNGAVRYIIGGPGKVLSEGHNSWYDSGDPHELIKAAKWLYQQYPAERYALVLWSHGSGWQPEEMHMVATQARNNDQIAKAELLERSAAPGSRAMFRTSLARILRVNEPTERAILFDDGSGHSLDTLELEDVMCQIQAVIGQPIDLLGMDACLMATLEVAYQVSRSVRCLAASQEPVPGTSWPYDQIYGELRSKPDCTARQLAVLIVKQYLAYYQANPQEAGVTEVAMDLTNIERIAHAISSLSSCLLENMDQSADKLWKIQVKTREKESCEERHKPNKFENHLWDIRSLAAGLIKAQTSSKVQAAARKVIESLAVKSQCVLAGGHIGKWFNDTGGVAIYLVPPGINRISPYYKELSLSADSYWNEMLEAYHNHFA